MHWVPFLNICWAPKACSQKRKETFCFLMVLHGIFDCNFIISQKELQRERQSSKGPVAIYLQHIHLRSAFCFGKRHMMQLWEDWNAVCWLHSTCLWRICTVCSGLHIFECVFLCGCICLIFDVKTQRSAVLYSSPRDATEIDGIHALCIPPPPPPFNPPPPSPNPPYTQTHIHHHHLLPRRLAHTLPLPFLSLSLSLIISCGHEPK